jgi:hypothetical protein
MATLTLRKTSLESSENPLTAMHPRGGPDGQFGWSG